MRDISVNSLKIKSFSFDCSSQRLSSTSSESESPHRPVKTIKARRNKVKAQTRKETKYSTKKYSTKKYSTDTKGQEKNIKYDTVYGETIPFYTRFYNQILGSKSNYRISKEQNTRYLLLSLPVAQKRIKYSQFMQKVVIKIQESGSKIEGDYIKLQDSESGIQKEICKTDIDLKSILNIKVRENPKDYRNWIELVEFQNTTRDSTSENLILEKQMFILEKALENLPQNVELLLKYLKISQKLLSDQEILDKWDRVLEFKKDFKIWEEYILFRLGLYSCYSFTNMIQVFEDCFQNLNLETRQDGDNFLLMLSRLTTFLDQAGKRFASFLRI
jgi:hypothetical protein